MNIKKVASALALAFPLAATPALARQNSVVLQFPPQSSLIETLDGTILKSSNADALRHPASLTKLMTALMVLESIQRGERTLDSLLAMTAHAASVENVKLGLPAGHTITYRDALQIMLARSTNDLAAAFADDLGGSETAFAQKMTQRARELGMANTIFRNASGLPDPEQVTTARDMAMLAAYIVKNSGGDLSFFAMDHVRFWNQQYPNINRFLHDYPLPLGVHADAGKTGFINASAFNSVQSVSTANGQHFIVVTFGSASGAEAYALDRRLIVDAMAAKNGTGAAQVAKAQGENPIQRVAQVQGAGSQRRATGHHHSYTIPLHPRGG